MRILMLDDEVKICEFVQACLDNEGYQTEVAHDGKTALSLFHQYTYDLILLDRMLPDVSGEEICKQIRQQSDIPIIMLTAKIEDEDRIEGFQLGCDDYIIKPFSLPVLLAKCKAITNRKHYQFLERGVLKLNTREKQAYLNNKNLNLKIIDYKILEYFIKNPNMILSREQILLKVWGFDYTGQERSVDTHIKILRKALGPYQKGIKTVIKQGYCFETKVFENG